MKGSMQKRLDAMTIEELFALHQRVQQLLGRKLKQRKDEIDRQLATLNVRSTKTKPVPMSRTKAKSVPTKSARAA